MWIKIILISFIPISSDLLLWCMKEPSVGLVSFLLLRNKHSKNYVYQYVILMIFFFFSWWFWHRLPCILFQRDALLEKSKSQLNCKVEKNTYYKAKRKLYPKLFVYNNRGMIVFVIILQKINIERQCMCVCV